MPHPMLANIVASVTEFQKDPIGTVEAGCGEVVAVLNSNEPAVSARIVEGDVVFEDDEEV